MSNYLITGGLGFIGLNILNLIGKQNLGNVSLIDNTNVHNFNENINVIGNTISDLNSLKDVNNVDGVILLAGLSGKNVKGTDDLFDLNVKANVNLVKEMLIKNGKPFHVIIPSSQLVYENSDLSQETLKLNPTNPYAKSKLFLEKELFKLAEVNTKLTVTSFRISNPFGPHIPVEQNYNYANQMLHKLWKGEGIELFHFGKVIKNYIPVQNVAKIFVKTINESLFGNKIINLGHYENTHMSDFFELAKGTFGRGEIKFIEGGQAEDAHLNVDNLYNEINTQDLLSIKQGIESFNEFFDNHENPKVSDLIHTS